MMASHWDVENRADLVIQPDGSCPHCTHAAMPGASLCDACAGALTLTTTMPTAGERDHTLWAVLSGRGYSLAAQPPLVRGLAAVEARDATLPSGFGGHDVGVCCRNHLAVTRWELGRADDASAHAREAVTLAARLGQPLTYATALYCSAWVHYHRGDHDVVEELARTLIAHALQRRLAPSWEADGRVLLLSARAGGPHSDEELRALETSIFSDPSGRSAWRDAFVRCLVASVHQRAGRARNTLESLSRLSPNMMNGNYAPEVYRVAGEALVAVGASSEHAEATFRKAIALARARQVVAFELRAGISLAMLLARRGERDAAAAMLRRIYAVFGEGFQTSDLRRARGLLDSLRASA
jgi:tetratricopeptide (TPR) repeat protein